MKIKDIHRGTLSLASFTCLAAALLLLVTACVNLLFFAKTSNSCMFHSRKLTMEKSVFILLLF